MGKAASSLRTAPICRLAMVFLQTIGGFILKHLVWLAKPDPSDHYTCAAILYNSSLW
jgi:hypothetical protein